MASAEEQTARYHLNRAVDGDAQALHSNYPWFWERPLWTARLFSIATRVSDIQETTIRSMVSELSELDLIELPFRDIG